MIWRTLLAMVLFAVVSTSVFAGSEPSGKDEVLEASYRLKIQKQGKVRERDWVLKRSEHWIASGDPSGEEEVWRRDARGNVTYEKVFHREKRILDYAASDLRALGQTSDWARLGSMIQPDAVGTALRASGMRRIGRFSGKEYSGAENNARLNLVWLANLQLPAYLKRTKDGESTEFVLRSIRHVNAATIEPRTADYVRMDYADLDDSPSDPFFQRLDQLAHASHSHR